MKSLQAVAFYKVCVVLCKKTIAMKKADRDYAAFERAMDECGIFREHADFQEICSVLDADAVSLDRRLYEELGWRGQALVDHYRDLEKIR